MGIRAWIGVPFALLAACGEVHTLGDPDAAADAASAASDGAAAAIDAAPATPLPDAAPGCAMRALFMSGDSKREVWTAAADGSGAINLSNSGADDFWPFWSPDGTRILFLSDRSGAADIWTVAPDGTAAVNLTQTNASAESMASWSPDGRRIAFWRDGGVWIMTSDGSLVTPITSAVVSPYVGLEWSPDGRFLLVGVRDTTGLRNHDLYLVPTSGGDLSNLTKTPDVNETIARFSPDGTRIVYAAAVNGSKPDIWTAASDGSGAINLTPNTPDSSDTSPWWAPSGREILFGSTREGGAYKAFTVPVTGGAPQRVYDNRMTAGPNGGVSGDIPYAVSPDGVAITFTRFDVGTSVAGVVHLDGSALVMLPGGMQASTWSPCLKGQP